VTRLPVLNRLPELPPQRLAAGYALGFVALFLGVVLWMRGLFRLVVPILLLVLAVVFLRRVWRAIRAPLP